MITIIADDEKNSFGAALREGFAARGTAAEYIPLQDVNVKACLACNGCTNKTFGKCVIRDDADWILPKLARADVIIFVSPVTFGSYSFKVKRVMDKLALVMDRHYYVKNGELVKNNMTGKLRLYGVGMTDDCQGFEAQAFLSLVHENLVITQCKGKGFLVDSVPASGTAEEIIREVLSA